MDRFAKIKSALESALSQKKLPMPVPSFNRTNLKNDVVLKPLVKQFAANRYKIFLQSIRSFLESEVVEVGEIHSFANKLFSVIDNDITVLQQNEQVRQLSMLINEKKLIQLQKELKALKIQVIASTEQIRSFDQVLEFTGGVLAGYNKRLNQCKQIYESMYKVQISTTLEIQTIYDPNVSEDYYDKYHNQLLEVLKRMRSSLYTLAEQIKMSSNVDVPLRCHNFLVNCRNLILELQSFLIDKNCVFNRLLSYVITTHQRNLNELLDIASDKGKINTIIFQVIYKNFYMFRLFDEEIQKIEVELQKSQKDIDKSFTNKNYNQVSKLYRQCTKLAEQHNTTLKDIKSFISNIDMEYMQFVTRTQLNVKTKKLIDMKNKVKEFQAYVNMLMKLGQNDSNLKEKEVELKLQGQKLFRSLSNFVQKTEPFNEGIFNKIYADIQERLIEISAIRETLMNMTSTISPEIQKNYLSQKLENFQNLLKLYFRTEKGLVNLIKEQKRGYQEETMKNINSADQALAKCRQCLDSLNPSIESDIWKWQKKQISRQTDYLRLITSAQGKMHKQKQSYQQKGMMEDQQTTNKKRQVENQLARMKVNFEALLRIYDTAVVPGTLTFIAEKLSFEGRQQAKAQIQQNKQCLEEIVEYQTALKQNQFPDTKNQLHPKVQQINKDRLNIMKEVVNTYSCLFQIYASLKLLPQPEELRNKYVPIGNEKVLKYLTMQYVSRKQLSNRIKDIKLNQKLIEKTKEFLQIKISDVLVSLEIRIQMKDLQKYIVALDRVMNFLSKVQQKINTLIERVNAPKDELYKNRVTGASQDLLDLINNVKVLQSLEDGPLGKVNFGNLRNEIKKLDDYFILAQQIVDERGVERMLLDIQLKDEKAESLRKRILQNMES